MRIRRSLAALITIAAGLFSALVAASSPAAAVTPGVGTWVAQPSQVVLPTTLIAARGTLTFVVTGAPVGSTSALHVAVASSQTTGWLAAYPTGGSSIASAVNYVPGQQASGLALVKVGSGGQVTISNHSTGWVKVNADRTGYYVGGTTPTAPGSFVPLATAVVLHTTSIGSFKSVRFQVPAPNGSTVALHGVVASSATSGWLAAYPDGGTSNVSFLNYVHGQPLSNLTLVQVGPGGWVDIANHSSGSVNVNADVQGYYMSGAALQADTFVALPSTPAFDTRKVGGAIPAFGTRTFPIAGMLGIPVGATVALHVVIASSTGNGWVAAYPDKGSSSVSVVNYTHGQQGSNLTFVTVGTGGGIKITNHSTGSVQVAADIIGFHRPVDNAPQIGHYLRSLTGVASDATTMQTLGASDRAAGYGYVLLDIGAQLNDGSGVQLSTTTHNLTYAQLVTDLQAYLNGYGAVTGATVAIATNNDADNWTTYPANDRGADWANKVVDLLHGGNGVSVVGADDIESEFFSTEAQAQQWEAAYLAAATTKRLVFVGAAVGCPTTIGSTASCSAGWTQAQYNMLAGGANPTQIHALPQIYNAGLANQWANIDRAGGSARIAFEGALTENATCGACSLTPVPAWTDLVGSLAQVGATPGAVDLDLEVN